MGRQRETSGARKEEGECFLALPISVQVKLRFNSSQRLLASSKVDILRQENMESERSICYEILCSKGESWASPVAEVLREPDSTWLTMA